MSPQWPTDPLERTERGLLGRLLGWIAARMVALAGRSKAKPD
ncbi:MAG TPA: hypothetical protein VFT84_05355 [Gemmatimonadales bacterium]|nr:hypothetical protein [Gemmatimonadales bacterium]